MKIWILKSHGIHGFLIDISRKSFSDQTCSISDPHFLNQMQPMGLHSTKTDKKFIGDFLSGILLND